MMSKQEIDFLIERIFEWYTHQVYGYPEDEMNGIIGTLKRVGDKIQFIQACHEAVNIFITWRLDEFTGEVDMDLVIPAPGAIHLFRLFVSKPGHQPTEAIEDLLQEERIILQTAKSARGTIFHN